MEVAGEVDGTGAHGGKRWMAPKKVDGPGRNAKKVDGPGRNARGAMRRSFGVFCWGKRFKVRSVADFTDNGE